MQKLPTVVGLKVCHEAIVQEGTRNVTLVNCFRELAFAAFPARVRPFVVCVVLTDGKGKGQLCVTVQDLDDLDGVWIGFWDLSITDELKEIWYVLPVNDCVVQHPGMYQVTLSVDREVLAQTRLHISEKGG